MMNKNILIIVLLFISVFSVFYAYIKANEAQQANIDAQECLDLAKKQEQLAIQAAAEAKRAQAEAEAAMKEANSVMAQLQECKNK